ncbi:MAG: exodeoxyribonuclease VII small subunit [Synechococcus sp. BS307-5m-G38]|jgi:exodeoxyribonuclease VII small subunit|nr:exodeoxyribonuclease VII small subunit [Synechococcus sp. BS307-5m-G38]
MSKASELKAKIKGWRNDAADLSYEEALQALDLLLADLQNDAVPLAELQQRVLHGEVYLDHCESLLKTVENTVVTLDPDSLKPTDVS